MVYKPSTAAEKKKALANRKKKRKADMAKPGKQGKAARDAEKRKLAAKKRAKKKYG